MQEPDRRQWPRGPSDNSQAILQLAQGPDRLCHVHDESLTGLCLVVSNTAGIEVDQQVFVVIGTERAAAVVRHVTRQPDQTFRVGLEWGSREVDYENVAELMQQILDSDCAS